MMSELGVRPILLFWAKMSKKRTRKIGLQRIQLLSSQTLRKGEKTFHAFKPLNFEVRARSQAQITILGTDEQLTDTKKLTARNSASELTSPLEMVKKTCQALESLNYDVRARSQARITMLGQDEQETYTKNRTSTNSASELTNPLEMVKKNMSGFGIAKL